MNIMKPMLNFSLSRFAVCKALVILLLVFCIFDFSQINTIYNEDITKLSGLEKLYFQNKTNNITSSKNSIHVRITKFLTKIDNKKDIVKRKIAKLIKSKIFNQQKINDTQLNFSSTSFSKYNSTALSFDTNEIKFLQTANVSKLSVSEHYFNVRSLNTHIEYSLLVAQNNYLFCRPPPIA